MQLHFCDRVTSNISVQEVYKISFPTRFYLMDPAWNSEWELVSCQIASISIPPSRQLIHLRPSQCDRYIHAYKDISQVGWAPKWMHQIAADTHNADFPLSL